MRGKPSINNYFDLIAIVNCSAAASVLLILNLANVDQSINESAFFYKVHINGASVDTVSKGNALEDAFHDYLVRQQDGGNLVNGAYPPHLCKIYKQKRYYSHYRKNHLIFDVVIEIFQENRPKPQLFVVFECKNYKGAVPDTEIRDFSHKLTDIFPNACKGVVVVATRLQSGAEETAKTCRLGVVKFDARGLEVVLDRTGRSFPEQSFISWQIRQSNFTSKSLKFSALLDGKFYYSIAHFVNDIVAFELNDAPHGMIDVGGAADQNTSVVAYLDEKFILDCAEKHLKRIGYSDGPVDIERLCNDLDILLIHLDESIVNIDGGQILGSANFEDRTIQIYRHENPGRERFTTAHEIGHFCLRHDRFLTSEALVEQDLLDVRQPSNSLNHDRLEWQANSFASALLLPDDIFKQKVAELRSKLDMVDRGHGYIFVDDQPRNYTDYVQLLTWVASYFDVSMQAVEVKLSRDKMLNDQRRKANTPRFSV